MMLLTSVMITECFVRVLLTVQLRPFRSMTGLLHQVVLLAPGPGYWLCIRSGGQRFGFRGSCRFGFFPTDPWCELAMPGFLLLLLPVLLVGELAVWNGVPSWPLRGFGFEIFRFALPPQFRLAGA